MEIPGTHLDSCNQQVRHTAAFGRPDGGRPRSAAQPSAGRPAGLTSSASASWLPGFQHRQVAHREPVVLDLLVDLHAEAKAATVGVGDTASNAFNDVVKSGVWSDVTSWF